MSSVLATRKMAGAGNFFVAAVDISTYNVNAVAQDNVDVSNNGPAFFVDLGERVGPSGGLTLARVRQINGSADNANGQDFTYVAIHDTAGNAVGVAHVGAGTRN
jgi:hypothetical protein